jgi:hypothetical protein
MSTNSSEVISVLGETDNLEKLNHKLFGKDILLRSNQILPG